MEEFTCRTCGNPTSDFRLLKSKTGKFNRVLDCRECEKKKARESRRARYETDEGRRAILEANSRYLTRPDVVERLSLEGRRKYSEDEAFRERVKNGARQWRTANHDKKKKRAKEYYQENKQAIQVKTREKQEENPWMKLRGHVRIRVHEAIRSAGSSKGGESVFKHLPYSLADLKRHLQNQFEEWMNWPNYGVAWQLDHVIPQSMFPYDSMESENFRLCWDLKNLRPLSTAQNFADGNREDLISFPNFDSAMDELTRFVEFPKTNETPADIFAKLSQLKLGDPCPMTFCGISYLDTLFAKRFSTKTVGNLSLADAAKNKESVLTVMAHLVKNGDKATVGSMLSNLKFLVRTPGHFFPGAASAIWSKYALSGSPCFDPFLGWGGRTLGAMCSDMDKLVGCDLQSEVVDSCSILSKVFSGLSKTRTEFHHQDALSFLRSTDEKFGMIFTSPPYMDTEDYGIQSDSMRAEWLDSFVFPLIEQFGAHLVEGGKVALHLKDIKGAPTFTAYHAAMRGCGFKQIARHKYGRTWTQAVYIYSRCPAVTGPG